MNRPRDERGRFISFVVRNNRGRGRGNTIARTSKRRPTGSGRAT